MFKIHSFFTAVAIAALIGLMIILVNYSEASFWMLVGVVFAGLSIGALWARVSDVRVRKILKQESKLRKVDWY